MRTRPPDAAAPFAYWSVPAPELLGRLESSADGRSRPGRVLLVSSLALSVVAFAIPYLPGVGVLGFVPLPAAIALVLAGIAALYVVATELLKRFFYARTPDFTSS